MHREDNESPFLRALDHDVHRLLGKMELMEAPSADHQVVLSIKFFVKRISANNALLIQLVDVLFLANIQHLL